MKCRHVIPDLVDSARGVPLERSRERALAQHLQTCARCAARLDTERAMSAALRNLAREAQPDGTANDVRLGRLLAAFDAPRRRPARTKLVVELALAASVLIVAGLSVGWNNDAPTPAASGSTAATTPAPLMNADSAFVLLPGADALPRFEHGQVIQVDIPSAEGVVRAEVLIGQDGLARAARLVQ
jgi:anti-sigma factor RsiW